MRNRKKVILAGVSIVITALLILSWGIFQKTSENDRLYGDFLAECGGTCK